MFKEDIKPQNEDITDITPEEALGMIKRNNSNLVIIDVRTPAEYSEGHIEGAENIDYNSFDFEETLEEMNKNKTYIVYCRSGVRSIVSCDIMKNLGFHDVYNIKGGMDACKTVRFPFLK